MANKQYYLIKLMDRFFKTIMKREKRSGASAMKDTTQTTDFGRRLFLSTLVVVFADSIFGVRRANAVDVADRTKKIIIEHLGVDEDKVSLEAKFVEDLGADSLDTVELVMAFEEEFGIEIPDEAAEKIVTVQDAISYVQQHVRP